MKTRKKYFFECGLELTNKCEGIEMSVVIIGGHECMERKYKQICKECGHDAKVYTRPTTAMRSGFGKADLLILFTSTVSHTMVKTAMQAARNECPLIERSHTSSAAALKNILSRYA